MGTLAAISLRTEGSFPQPPLKRSIEIPRPYFEISLGGFLFPSRTWVLISKTHTHIYTDTQMEVLLISMESSNVRIPGNVDAGRDSRKARVFKEVRLI